MKNDPDALYPDHLAQLRVRMDRALAAHGFDGVAIYSGSAGFAFLDDHSYPFRANPHFKHWVPLTALQQSFVGYVARAEAGPVLPPAGRLLAQAADAADRVVAG